jgi:WD40 repeat protein
VKSLSLQCLLLIICCAGISAQRQASYRPPRDPFVIKTAVSPDGGTLAIARSSTDITERLGRVELWDIKSGTLKLTINGFDGPVWGVNFSSDGQTILTASTELRDYKIQTSARPDEGEVFSELKFWDALNGEFKRRVKLPGEARRSLDAVWSSEGTVALIERYSAAGLDPPEDPLFGSLSAPLPRSVRRPPQGWSAREGINIKLLNAETGAARVKVKGGSYTYNVFQARFGRLERPAFSADGAVLAVIAADEVRLWNTRSGERLQTLKDLKGQPKAIAFSRDSRSIAIASVSVHEGARESEITVWDVATAKVIKKINGRNDAVATLEFIADSRALLIGSLQYEPERTVGTVKIWDLQTNRLASFNVNDSESVSFVKLLSDQNTLVLQSGNDIEIRDVKSWKVRYKFEGSRAEGDRAKGSRYLLSVKSVSSVAFSADGNSVVGEIPEEGIKIWDARTGGIKNHLRHENSGASMMALSGDGKSVVNVEGETLKVWNLSNATNNSVPVEGLSSASVLATSRNGEQVALASENEILLVASGATRRLKGHTAPVESIVFAVNAQVLVSVDELGGIRVWDSDSGQFKSTFSTGGRVTALAVDQSGQLVATASEDNVVSIWDLRTRGNVAKLKKHESRINALAFSPDAKLLASGGDDRSVVLWEVGSGRSKHVMKGHDLTVSSLVFSHDGKSIASGSGNASVVLWDATTGKLNRILR